jgi:hypothetical protein
MAELYLLGCGSPTSKRQRIASKYLDYNKICLDINAPTEAEAMAAMPISTAP